MENNAQPTADTGVYDEQLTTADLPDPALSTDDTPPPLPELIPEPDSPLSERDRIAAQREQELLAEIGKPTDDDANNEETSLPPSPPTTVKVKIDGVEEEVALADVLKNYQKSEAGDRKLREAALERQRLDEERLRFEQERHAAALHNQASEGNKGGEQAPDAGDIGLKIEQLKQARRESLEFADYEEFERLDEEISRLRVGAIPDPVVLTQQATDNALRQIQYESAHEKFIAQNLELTQDPVLYNMTMHTFNEMCKQSSTYQEAFNKTGEAMKSWLSRVAGVVKPSGDAATATRQANKNSIPNEPGRANAVLTPPQAQKEQTPTEIINEMRQSRGLPV